MMSSSEIRPVVGMGVTEVLYSDRQANTIIKVSSTGKTIWIQRDIVIRTDYNGMSDNQTYTYFPDPEGVIQKCTIRKDGNFRTLGECGSLVLLDIKDEYYDYSI